MWLSLNRSWVRRRERVPTSGTAPSVTAMMAKGDGPYASVLKEKPADLTQLAKKNNGTFPIARVTRILDGSEVIPAHGTRQKPLWVHEFGAAEEAAGNNAAPTVARERIQ